MSAKRIRSAVTDNDAEIRYDRENKPGVSNLLVIQGALTDKDPKDLAAKYQESGVGYGELKKDTAEALEAFTTPLKARYEEFMSDRAQLEKILANGAERARYEAHKTLRKVHKTIGFLPESK